MITTNTDGSTLSTAFTDAIDSSVLSTKARVVIDWLDSRHLEYTSGGEVQSVQATTNDAHSSSARGGIGHFFDPAQSVNGFERQSYLWGVCGALDVNGQTIRADGRWAAMPDENKGRYEYGWWSASRSSATDGTFASGSEPHVQLVFDSARVTHIRVNTSEFYGQVSSIKVEYKKAGASTWTVHDASASIAAGSYFYESEINAGDYFDLIGVRVTALATRNKDDHARFNEISPIYREDVTPYLTALNVNKVHTIHDSSLPIGATAANSGTFSLDNTSSRFSPFATAGVGKYVRKDLRIVVDMGVLVDEDTETYEYVPYGTFWVDNWNISAGMHIQGQFRDYTKFLSELLIDDGFLIEDVLAGRAVTDLALKSNFPKADVDYLKRFEDEVVDKGGVVHLRFTDSNPFNETIVSNTADDGVWANWWNKEQDRWKPIADIDIEYNALRDTVKQINFAASPNTREVVSSSTNALTINGLNNGSSNVFTSGQTSGGYPYYINARFNTFYISPSSGNVRFRFTIQNGGIRVKMNDVMIVDEYSNVDTPYNTDSVYDVDVGTLRQNAPYQIEIDYYHWYGTQKLVWQYSTNGGTSWSNVPTSDTSLVAARDNIGVRETYGTAYDNDHYNHGVYLNSSSSVRLGEAGGVVSDSSNESVIFNNTSNANYQHVKIPYDVSYNLASSTSANYTGAYSIEALAQFDAAIGGKGVYAGNIDDANSATKGVGLFYTTAGNGVYLRDGSQTLSVSITDSSAFAQTKWTHVVATYDGTTLSYYVNGVLKGTDTGSGHASWASQDFLVGKSSDTSSGSSADYYFDGKFDQMAVYNQALTAAEVLESYYVISMVELIKYDYLWGNDTDAFNLMQEIATADLGMFYFDENNKFNYHHYNRLYESFIDRHSTVQKTISDDSFIVGGSTPIDLQANKVTVTVNNPTIEAAGRQGIWRPPSPTTMVVAGLSANMTSSQTSMSVTTTQGEFPWYDSGYLRVDDEIMQYNSRTLYSFEGITRGMFGTTAAAHTAVVDGETTKVRETKVFDVKYSQTPAVDIRYPLIALIDFEDTPLATIDLWEPTPFGAQLVISASDDVGIGDLLYLEGSNAVTKLGYFTSIAGVPINVKSQSQQVVEQSASNHPSIRKYGLKAIEIVNKFITSASWAEIIASFVRDKFQDVVMVLSIDAAGVPQLQLGDRIKIETFDNLSISNKEYWVIEIGMKYDGGLTQRLVLREAA